MDHVTYILFTTGIRIDENHPCYISGKNDPIPTKQKANIFIKFCASNVTIAFGLGYDLDLEF